MSGKIRFKSRVGHLGLHSLSFRYRCILKGKLQDDLVINTWRESSVERVVSSMRLLRKALYKSLPGQM